MPGSDDVRPDDVRPDDVRSDDVRSDDARSDDAGGDHDGRRVDDSSELDDVRPDDQVPIDDPHHVYVLECADGSLYTGYTTDVERRVREHDDGDGAKYTRCRTPVELVHTETYASRSAATTREHEIKQLTRREKERLVGLGGRDRR